MSGAFRAKCGALIFFGIFSNIRKEDNYSCVEAPHSMYGHIIRLDYMSCVRMDTLRVGYICFIITQGI